MARRERPGIASNALILTVGTVLQMVIALVTVPLYLSQLGEERFGAWVIAGLIIAYFSLLDRGLNTAVQNEVSRLGGDADLRSTIVWTAVLFNALFGLVAGAGVLVVGEIAFAWVVELPKELHQEIIGALPLMAASVPFAMVNAIFQGALMARGRITTVSVIDTLRLFGLQLVPLWFVYWHGPDLRWLAFGVLLVFVVFTFVYLIACLELALPPRRFARPSRTVAVRLFHFGKWVTATSVLTPLLDFSDRLVIAAVRGASAVTVYSIPYNLTSRLTTIPLNVIRVTFPRFSAVSVEDSRALGATAVAAIAAVTAPLAVIGSLAAGPFFEWWLGSDVAEQSGPIAAVLFAAFWINGLGYVPQTLLQAQGRPDLPARFHALELAPFLVVLAIGVYVAGPMGGAIAWAGRALADALLLLTAAHIGWWDNRAMLSTAAVVAAAAGFGAVFAFETAALVVLGIPLVVLSVAGAWRLTPEEIRTRILGRARRRGLAADESP